MQRRPLIWQSELRTASPDSVGVVFRRMAGTVFEGLGVRPDNPPAGSWNVMLAATQKPGRNTTFCPVLGSVARQFSVWSPCRTGTDALGRMPGGA